jgi:hypothetical protein
VELVAVADTHTTNREDEQMPSEDRQDVEAGYDEESTACGYCGDRDAEQYVFGRQGRRDDGTWGVASTYTQVLCYRCARRAGAA